MKSYLTCEWIKVKNRRILLYALLMIILLTLFSFRISCNIGYANNINPFKVFWTIDISGFLTIVFPFLSVIFIAMYMHMEESDCGWKIVSLCGGNIKRLLFSKLILCFIIVACVYVMFLLSLILVNVFGSGGASNTDLLASMMVSLVGALLNILILFLIFLIIKRIVVNVIVGVFVVLINNIIIQTSFWKYVVTTYYYNNLYFQEGIFYRLLICISAIIILAFLIVNVLYRSVKKEASR